VGRLRTEIAGATYHVIARGVDRRRIFVDDEDYETYTRLLATATRRQGWHLLGYCLMPNHVHLLIETPETNLGNGMQWLQSIYALAFNERHCRDGHLFQGRYKSPLVDGDEAFVKTTAYIAVNPVAAALCKRARDWPWGSHALVSRARPVPAWLAHDRLVDRLEAITSARCYDELIATWERARY
jgi:REP-associated tyrosine transposase